jgi:hypothetical protein
MRPTWVDAEVAGAWCRFVDLMDERKAPTDVMNLLMHVDHALLSEAVTQHASNADATRRPLVGVRSAALIKRKRH